MIGDRDTELKQMKKINLVDFLAARGFEIDPRKSWASGKVMVKGDLKLTIGRGPDGNFLWIGAAGAGSIFDYLQTVERFSNLGECRKELRPWLTRAVGGPPAVRHVSAALKPTTRDQFGVQAAWAAMTPILDGVHPYLNQVRGIPPEILTLPLLHDKLRRDDTRGFGNVVFPHTDAEGEICGYIALNQGWKGFAPGGTKALFLSYPGPEDRRLVVAEGVLDGLSYLKLFGPENARIATFEGTMNHQQPALLAAAIKSLPHGEVIAAVDNDAGGDKFAEQLAGIFQEAGRTDLQFRRHSPRIRGLDWNAELTPGRGPSPGLSYGS